jgi:antitoxin (DNA-binding transcriptional repressor) of toxin-antitoxin stability system
VIKLNVHEAKTHLSRYLAKLEEGEVIVLCRRNVPIAEIRAIAKPRGERPIGLAKGEFEVPEAFFEPLPDEIIDAFEGTNHGARGERGGGN